MYEEHIIMGTCNVINSNLKQQGKNCFCIWYVASRNDFFLAKTINVNVHRSSVYWTSRSSCKHFSHCSFVLCTCLMRSSSNWSCSIVSIILRVVHARVPRWNYARASTSELGVKSRSQKRRKWGKVCVSVCKRVRMHVGVGTENWYLYIYIYIYI